MARIKKINFTKSVLTKNTGFIFLCIYIGFILVFSGLFTLYSDEFYHTTIKYENSVQDTYKYIKDEIELSIKKNFIDINNGQTAYLDDEQGWILDINDLYVTDFNADGRNLNISLVVYLFNKGTSATGWIQTNDKFQLHSYGGSLKSNSEIHTFYFRLINETPTNLTDLGYSKIELDRIFTIKENKVCSIKLPMEVSRKLKIFVDSLNGLPYGLKGTYKRMLYLSMVTITTLGYGDIVPITNRARLLVGLESVLGIIIIGLFISSIFNKLSNNARE
ncbi:potassium channel family protein [Vallitalea pronyensis]|nr:potassium channel family protein [Vallitalea pronyensis]